MSVDLLSSFVPAAEQFPFRPLTLVVGGTFGPFYINFYASQPTLVGQYTADPNTNTFTLANHGLTNGTMVQVTALPTVSLTDGLETGLLYFIANKTTNTFQLSLSCFPPFSSFSNIVEIDNNFGGNIFTTGEPYDFTNHKVWAWVKHFPTDPDNQLVLDLKPTFAGAELCVNHAWRVTFTVPSSQTFNLTPSNNFWSLLIQFPDGSRSLMVDNCPFIIKLPTTHPNLIS